jgi:type I restriction enzyme, R subunit
VEYEQFLLKAEAQVLNALFPLLDRDRAATLALFELVKNQPGY